MGSSAIRSAAMPTGLPVTASFSLRPTMRARMSLAKSSTRRRNRSARYWRTSHDARSELTHPMLDHVGVEAARPSLRRGVRYHDAARQTDVAQRVIVESDQRLDDLMAPP